LGGLIGAAARAQALDRDAALMVDLSFEVMGTIHVPRFMPAPTSRTSSPWLLRRDFPRCACAARVRTLDRSGARGSSPRSEATSPLRPLGARIANGTTKTTALARAQALDGWRPLSSRTSGALSSRESR